MRSIKHLRALHYRLSEAIWTVERDNRATFGGDPTLGEETKKEIQDALFHAFQQGDISQALPLVKSETAIRVISALIEDITGLKEEALRDLFYHENAPDGDSREIARLAEEVTLWEMLIPAPPIPAQTPTPYHIPGSTGMVIDN